MIKNEPFMKNLKCKLTTEEKAMLSQRVVELVSNKEEVERERSAASARFGGQLKNIWAEIADLSQRHREGVEYREVECFTEFNWGDGVAKVIRSDNYEMVSSRTITSDERQMHLDEFDQTGQTCAQCGYQLVEDQALCPECGFDQTAASDDADRGGGDAGTGEGIPDGSEGDGEYVRDDKALQVLLAQVMGKKLTLKKIRAFSEDEHKEAKNWGELTRLKSEDDSIFIPDMPEFLEN